MNLKLISNVIALCAAPAMAQNASPAGEAPTAKGRKFFESTDTNKDGVISQAEWTAAGRKPEGFAMMDLNKDGNVTREEGRAAMQKMMQMRNAPPSEKD